MLMVILMGCADFQGTDFRQGWTEVECDVDGFDDRNLMEVEAPDRMVGPRPAFAMAHRIDPARWESAYVYGIDGTTYTLSPGGPEEEFDACRLWIAE